MTLLLIMIALTNVALGFTAAMVLGFGPPGLPEAWHAAMYAPPPSPREREADAAATDSAAWSPLAEDDDALDLSDAPPESLASMLAMDAPGEVDLEPIEQAYDNDFESVAALLSPDAPEAWNLDEKYVETSILKLNVAMMKSGARATEVDTRLRLARGATDPATIQECLDQLREDCENYLNEQSAAAEKLHSRIEELGELRSLGEEIELSNLEQAAQIETTLSNLRHMDFSSDLEAANHRLLQEIHHLRIARHRLRDSQEEAFLVVARYENRLDKIERQLFTDPLTRLRNRTGLETTLWRWWQENRPQTRQMSAALFDLDAFGKLNEEHGSLVCDKLLYQLGQWFAQAIGKDDLLGRFAGQRFLVVAVDSGPRAALKSIETWRQSLAQLTFFDGDRPIRLTSCVGLAEVAPADSYDAVLARCAASVAAAKQAGPNRAARHDGRAVEAVASPNFGPTPQEIVL